MANSLLDFVMSLVRDSGAADAYAANPEQAIADANLAGVTSADVDQLIPMVTDSMATPLGGAVDMMDDNVWASGAATSAFDAFSTVDPVSSGAVGADDLIDTHTIVNAAPDPADLPGAVSDLPNFDALSPDTVDPVIEQAGSVFDESGLADALPESFDFDDAGFDTLT